MSDDSRFNLKCQINIIPIKIEIHENIPAQVIFHAMIDRMKIKERLLPLKLPPGKSAFEPEPKKLGNVECLPWRIFLEMLWSDQII